MKRLSLTLLLLVACLSISFAQTDWKTELKQDLVTISDNKYQIEDFALITFEDGATMQFKTSASADTDPISRDQFVSIYSSLGTILLVSILQEAGVKFEEVSMKNLDELIGKADLTIHMEMTKNGLQMSITTEDGTERETMTWDEFYENN